MRSYRLLCPIARALDLLGDRWTLLILRDLHPGPARFSDLHAGLPGLATNLLTTRLQTLQRDGLIQHRASESGKVYELTEEGERSAGVLFELARFGSRVPHPDDPKPTGNLRLVAVTLKEALRRSGPGTLEAELTIDGEPFAISMDDSRVDVRYEANAKAGLRVSTQYLSLLGAIEGDIPAREFLASHVTVEKGGKRRVADLFDRIGRGLAG
ncbi:MAG: helix-turn-helix domain-containing protein [Myxococcota bacterium]